MLASLSWASSLLSGVKHNQFSCTMYKFPYRQLKLVISIKYPKSIKGDHIRWNYQKHMEVMFFIDSLSLGISSRCHWSCLTPMQKSLTGNCLTPVHNSFKSCLTLIHHPFVGCLTHIFLWSHLTSYTIYSHAKYNKNMISLYFLLNQTLNLSIQVYHNRGTSNNKKLVLFNIVNAIAVYL